MYCTPTRCPMRIVLWILCLGSSVPPAVADPPSDAVEKKSEIPQPQELIGVVVKVIDGDSIKIREDGVDVTHEVQIEGTDAPELKQAYGDESADALRKLVLERKVRITWLKKDNFDRQLAQVYLDDPANDGENHINKIMIRDGHAWHFKRYNQSKELADLEEEARKAKRGLWATNNPQAPWDYRKENRSPDKPDR